MRLFKITGSNKRFALDAMAFVAAVDENAALQAIYAQDPDFLVITITDVTGKTGVIGVHYAR